MRRLLLALCIYLTVQVTAQAQDSTENQYNNAAGELLQKDGRLVIGGYGEVHYNQQLEAGSSHTGELDVHRMVLLFGYNFSEKTKFVSEIEIEHVKEVYVEQAFLQHKLTRNMNFRAGLMLIPMGIINEYHEPTTFNGVERPALDKYLTPTTWREIGLGINGTILPASMKYQVYLMNGFNGYDGSAKLNGKNGLRNGRQKGAESYISSPALSGKLEFFGIRGLNIGLSAYTGKSQSTLYDQLEKSDEHARSTADSSIVGISMLGIDSRYSLLGFQFRGQFYFTNINNSTQYNEFIETSTGELNDLASSMIGYYAEIGYNVLKKTESSTELIPFFRYEFYDTHHTVDGSLSKNPAYNSSILTSGITLKLTHGAVLKTDFQVIKNEADIQAKKMINAGFGIMF